MNAYHNAAKSYKKSDPEGQLAPQLLDVFTHAEVLNLCLMTVAAVSALHQTIKLLIKAGSFRQAADREKEVRGDLLELCGIR